MVRWILHLFHGLILVRISSGEFNIIRGSLRNSEESQRPELYCVTDSVHDAIVWNTYFYANEYTFSFGGGKASQSVPEYFVNGKSETIGRRECYINENVSDCMVQFGFDTYWGMVSSAEVPMGPVFDSRWTYFGEFDTRHWGPREYRKIGDFKESVNMAYSKTHALSVSIRGGSLAQFMLCQDRNFNFGFCYLITISGLGDAKASISKCVQEGSLPAFPGQCTEERIHVDNDLLNVVEWKTYVITCDFVNKTIKLYNPNEEILSYIYDNFPIIDQREYHILFGNSHLGVERLQNPSMFRFHHYKYSLLSTSDIRVISKPLNIDAKGEICISMAFGLCKSCDLQVHLMYTHNTQIIVSKVFSGSTRFQRIQHDLPMWQHAEIRASDLDKNNKSITLEMITRSKGENGHHWAIDEIIQCLPAGMVKVISMPSPGRELNEDYIWPNVTCQKLSNDQEGPEMINSITNVTDPPEMVNDCPKSRIGPRCAFQCDFDCQSTSICNENGCYCSPGYRSQKCNEPCTELGAFGYGCAKNCVNCEGKVCDIFTGKCRFGCQKSQAENKFFIPPYCKDAADFPPAPDVTQVDEDALYVYFSPQFDDEQRFEITYEFEISIQPPTGAVLKMKQLATTEMKMLNNKTIPVYSTTFQNLPIGSECKARVVKLIEIESNDSNIAMEPLSFSGAYSLNTIICRWDRSFNIYITETNVTLVRRQNSKTAMHSCYDRWYSAKVSSKTSNDSKVSSVQRVRVKSMHGKFPMTFKNLVPNTNYEISITGRSPAYNLVKRIWTQPPNGKISITWVSFNDSSVDRQLPRGHNITNYVFELSVIDHCLKEILGYLGCLNSTSVDSFSVDTRIIEYLRASTLSSLAPYAHYRLTFWPRDSMQSEASSHEFTTRAARTPSEVYENLKIENERIAWDLPANCSFMTGPIRASRLFFFGVSENVKDFRDQHDTLDYSFILNGTKKQDIHGYEQYKVRIHALREINGIHNESAYAELNFTTDPRPPPKVRDLTIVEINFEKATTYLRWKKPLPPTNGEIIRYKIDTIGNFVHGANTILPNETCPLWNDSLCKTIWNINKTNRTIKVRAMNKDVIEGGEWSAIEDLFQETAPDPPGEVEVAKMKLRKIELNWKHPTRTGGPMKQFIIQLKLISTRLVEDLLDSDRNQTIHFPIMNYQSSYKIQLNLLPSTRYKINVQGVVESPMNTLIGNASSIVIETASSLAFKFKPRYAVNNNDFVIALSLPSIVHKTRNTHVHIILISPTVCSATQLVKGNLASAIQLKDDETAWIVGSFLTPPTSILIGNHDNSDNITNCPLHADSSYVIVIVVHENDIDQLNEAQPLIWRSKLIQISPVYRLAHETWAVPVVLLLIIIICIIFYIARKKKLTTQMNSNLVYDIPDNVSRPMTIECRASFLLRVSYDDVNKMTTDETIYDEIMYTELVKLNRFQDYVKTALASGKLDEQYSLLLPHNADPWKCEAILGSEEDKLAVVFTKQLDNPDSLRLNAYYINGYKQNEAYIVLEGPEPAEVVNFWRMIWKERVQVICMLSGDLDDEQTKYRQYWPEVEQSRSFANITVSNINHAKSADYTFRTFHLRCGREIRKIEHLHYTAWPDHGSPQYTQSLVTYLQKLLAVASGVGPVLIHCSINFGRAGTVILCDICLRRAAAEGVMDVFAETEGLKKQHRDMVNDKQQYILAHVTLVECLLSLPTAIQCDGALLTRIKKYRNQLELQRQRLEQSAWQDEALQVSMRLQYKLSAKNIAKNRFADSLPMSRLYIPRYPTTDDDSSYLSGVYVDSARRRNSYIASQLPMPTTVTDFWRMIAAFKVELIIILQRPDIEDPTCCNFLPGPDETIELLSFLNIKGKIVENEKEHFSQQGVVLIDNSMKSPREQQITTLTCKDWNPGRRELPPKPENLINLWQMSERFQEILQLLFYASGDGVTGCGLYLALGFLLERMGLEHECDVCFAIRAIRRSRSDFCQTQDQFEYLYDAALLYAADFDAYANFK